MGRRRRSICLRLGSRWRGRVEGGGRGRPLILAVDRHDGHTLVINLRYNTDRLSLLPVAFNLPVQFPRSGWTLQRGVQIADSDTLERAASQSLGLSNPTDILNDRGASELPRL